MNRQASKLSYLMDTMNVTGRELAKFLNVDYSLVSKWRTGKRPLTMRSSHLPKIALYLADLDRSSKKNTLHKILGFDKPDSCKPHFDDLIHALSLWLSDEAEIDPSQKIFSLQSFKSPNRQSAEYNAYKGNSERRAAVIQFLDYTLSLPEGQHIYLISQESTDWMTEDEAFFPIWQEKLIEILKRNHKIQIIHWIDRKTDTLAAMLIKWLPLHLTGKIDAWFYPHYSAPLIKTTLFIVENHLAMIGMDESPPTISRYTALFRDTLSVQHYMSVYKGLLQPCLPLIETCRMPDCHRFMERIHSSHSGHQSLFLISDLFQYSTMSKALFEELLDSNNLDSETYSRCMSFYNRSSANFSLSKKRFKIRHIYDLQRLAQAASGEANPFPELSIAAGFTLNVPHAIFKKHIDHLIENLEKNPNFELALTNFHQIPQLLPVSLWMEQSNYILAWAPSMGDILAMATEPTLVNAFYYYYEHIWGSIPRVSHTKELVIAELEKLAETGNL